MFNLLLILIFIRPFISSLGFPCLNAAYSALLLIFLTTWFVSKGISFNKIKSFKYTPPLILFCLALIISGIFSGNMLKSFAELYKYASGILLFLIATALTSEEKKHLIQSIVLAGFIISLLAIYQYFFGFGHILNYITKEKITNPFALNYLAEKRVFFPFVTPNTLAGYLAMIIPLTLSYKNKILYIIPLGCALLLTKSLGGLLSLFLGLLLYFCLQGKIGKKKIILLITLIISIGLVFISRVIIAQQHFQPAFSTLMRLNYWKDTLVIIKNHLLTGVGAGNFNLIQSRYAHNSYLQLWAETGILGIISFFGLIIAVFKYAAKNIRVCADKNQLLGLITANAVFLIHNLVDFTFFLPEVSLIWWVILGIGAFSYLRSE